MTGRIVKASLAAALLLSMAPTAAHADAQPKVYVCKYVGTPGTDERLQTGQNPIEVAAPALPDFPGTFPWAFADRHGRSVAIGFVGGPVLTVADCPAADPQPDPDPDPTKDPTPEPEPSETPDPDPTDDPEPKPDHDITVTTVADYPTPTPHTTRTLPNTGAGLNGLLALLGVALVGIGGSLIRRGRA